MINSISVFSAYCVGGSRAVDAKDADICTCLLETHPPLVKDSCQITDPELSQLLDLLLPSERTWRGPRHTLSDVSCPQAIVISAGKYGTSRIHKIRTQKGELTINIEKILNGKI